MFHDHLKKALHFSCCAIMHQKYVAVTIDLCGHLALVILLASSLYFFVGSYMGLPKSKDLYYNFPLLCFLQFGTLDWVLRISADTFYFSARSCGSTTASRYPCPDVRASASFSASSNVEQISKKFHKSFN